MELTQDVKCLVQSTESSDQHVKFNCWINRMMPGNYARTLFETPHSVLLELTVPINQTESKPQLNPVFTYWVYSGFT